MAVELNVDVPKVKGKMAEKGYNNSSFADKLGINRNTLASYLVDPGKIPLDTIFKMADVLCDSREEATGIFFAPKLT